MVLTKALALKHLMYVSQPPAIYRWSKEQSGLTHILSSSIKN